MQTMDIQAVIFDADGTILDTREFIIQAFEHSLDTHGHPVPSRSHMMATVAGIMLDDCYVRLAPDGDVIALCDTHRSFQQDRYDLIVAYEGLDDVIAILRKDGIKLGICSSRGKTLKPSLNHMKIGHHFDVVIDAHDVKRHKPHPEPVLKTLELLGVAPGHAVMVGDTPADIGAAHAAGLALAIGVTHGFGTREMFEAANADRIIDSLRELPALVLPKAS